MGSATASIEIDASREAVFDLLHDYDRRLQWDPFLREARVLGDAGGVGVGTRTFCAARWRCGGFGMETEYVSYRRPGVAAVRMTRGPWFLSEFAASLSQDALGPSSTRVTYKFLLRARPRWLGRFFEPVLQRVFLRETRRRLCSLKGYLETVRAS